MKHVRILWHRSTSVTGVGSIPTRENEIFIYIYIYNIYLNLYFHSGAFRVAENCERKCLYEIMGSGCLNNRLSSSFYTV